MPEESKEKTQKKRWTLKKVKTRCRTIYWQNFLLTASVVMLTLALLGSAFFALHQAWTQKQQVITNALNEFEASLTSTERDNMSTDEAQSASYNRFAGRLG